MLLTELKTGKQATVLTVNSSVHKVQLLGLVPGAKIKVVSTISGNMEILVHGARIVVSKDIANEIIINEN